MTIYIIFLIKYKIQQRKKKLLHNLKNYVAVLKVLASKVCKTTLKFLEKILLYVIAMCRTG